MHNWGFESEAQALDEQNKRFVEKMDKDRAAAEAFGKPDGRSTPTPWRAWLLVGLVAAIAVIWFVGGNTPSLIAGVVTAAVAVALAVRLLRLRRS